MINKERFVEELERMSRERFQKVCINLLEKMGFDIITAKSMSGDFETEAELQMESRLHDYIIKITRSRGEPAREVRAMRKLVAPGMKGLYITTERVGTPLKDVERTEVVDRDKFYDLMKEYDLLPTIEPSKTEGRTLPSASEADRLMEWGDEFLKRKNYPNALEYYDKAIKQKPEAIKPRLMKAEVLINMGEAERAKNILMESVEREIRSPDLWTSLGKALHELGEYEEEIEAYDRALDINEDHTEAWRNKGATLYEEGLYDEAELCFDRVLEVEPKDEGAWNNKGLCLFKRGDLAGAVHCINNALEISPDYIDALINKALVLENQNKISAALRIMEKLVNMRPEKAEFHYTRAAYLEALGDIEEAFKSAERAFKLNPNHMRTLRLKQRLEERVDEFPAYRKKEERITPDGLEEEKKVLYEKVNGLEDDIQKLKEEKKVDKDEIKEKEILQKTLEEKDEELRKLREDKKGLEKEISSIGDGRSEGDVRSGKIVEERDRLKAALKNKESELQELMDMKETLGVSEKKERRILEKDIEEKKKEIEELSEKKGKISSEVQEFVEEIEKLRDKKLSLEEEIEKLEGKIPSKDVNKLIQEKERARQELGDKQKEIEELKKTHDRMLDDLVRYRREEEKTEGVIKDSRRGVKVDEGDVKLKRTARLLYCMGEYEEALELIGKADDKEIVNTKGCCYYVLGMEDEAEKAFREAGDLLIAKYNLEELLFSQSRYGEAGKISDQIMDHMREDLVFWEKRGEVMRRLKDYEDAILSYHKVNEIAGIAPFDVIKTKAKCRVEIDGMKETLKELKTEYSSSPGMKNLVGTYLYASRQYKRSMKIFRDAVQFPVALHHNNLGCAAYQLERYGEALSSFEKSVELENDELYLNNLGFCQLERNLLEAAESTFEKAVNLSPNDASSWYHLGIAMKRLERGGWKNKIEQAVELRGDFEAAKRLLKT